MHDLPTATTFDHGDDAEYVASNRVRALALDILHRIRPVCALMPDEELLALSTRIAAVELRHFERAGARTPGRRRAVNG